jgi:hypothetical protein
MLFFGVHAKSHVILKALGITPGDIPRFRDCYLDEGKIVIHTRTGGGNLEEYEEENENLTQIPGYLYDEDDNFDSTYANFYYTYPEEFKTELEILEKDPESTIKPSQKWESLLNSIAQ